MRRIVKSKNTGRIRQKKVEWRFVCTWHRMWGPLQNVTVFLWGPRFFLILYCDIVFLVLYVLSIRPWIARNVGDLFILNADQWDTPVYFYRRIQLGHNSHFQVSLGSWPVARSNTILTKYQYTQALPILHYYFWWKLFFTNIFSQCSPSILAKSGDRRLY